MMETLELHQLDLRYAPLRSEHPAYEKELLASLSEVGQRVPVVVTGDKPVLVDGYKRVRALRRLGRDQVQVMRWSLGEAEALIMQRLLQDGERDHALEQGWFLQELQERFGLGESELARRLGRTPSWVCRRLGLVQQLSQEVQQGVREGRISAYVAMRYLVPVARANEADALALAKWMGTQKVSSRQAGQVYTAYQQGTPKAREWIVSNPALVARTEPAPKPAERPEDALLRDVECLAWTCRRACKRLSECAALDAGCQALLKHNLEMAQAELGRLMARAIGAADAG